MRRRGRSVHRNRTEEAAGEPDALALAFPGLACGILAIALALYAGTLRRVPGIAPLMPIAPVTSQGVAPLATSSLAIPDSSSLAALTSARRSDKP